MRKSFHVKYSLYLCQVLTILEFSRHISEKGPDIKFHQIRPVEVNLPHTDERTDRHDEANSRFPQILRTRLTLKHYFVFE